jgi:biotin operon repressor
MTQLETILSHLKRAKSISQREAMIDYSIQSLTKRISELREMGYKIKTVHKHHPVTGQRYARYVMGR